MKLPIVAVIVLLMNYNSTPIRREIEVSKIIFFGNSGILFWQEFREFYFGRRSGILFWQKIDEVVD